MPKSPSRTSKTQKDDEKAGGKKIYPIARIVVFKDSELANKKPEWSFKEKTEVSGKTAAENRSSIRL